MVLPALDLRGMGEVARRDANRQLVRYLRDRMALSLRRLPGDAQYLDELVTQAGEAAVSLGYGEGQAYSFYIVTSFLLGLGWQNDPTCGDIEPILASAGMDQDSRLTMALQTAIRERQQRESALASMHAIVLEALPATPDKVSSREMWLTWDAVTKQRGLSVEMALACYETYECDARQRMGLLPVERTPLNAYQRLGYQHMGIPLPTVVDDLRDMNEEHIARLSMHVFLALAFGRHYLVNPLLHGLHLAVDEAATLRERWQRWRDFLHNHHKLLKEA
ncbi:hypothetical protein G3N59_30680 [Paraburkholderia sp. Ac-20340]|uniref:hypothetical protein n=1 Tax=Paraburkholderia sp. Ac-20340 TaxID=2703888 RepID=UPI001981059F|nr:hypothetical protein [Paraburkholderia sp. Ac-20340]MBN3857760.1 hypothetical protein [Paraburkholderia sp. Ac-20340]